MFSSFARLTAKCIRGSISHETKVGRLAKLIHCESQNRARTFKFVALGDELIGKMVKAICLSQEGVYNSGSISANPLRVVPSMFHTDEKVRPIPSVEFFISSYDHRGKDADGRGLSINVSATKTPEELAKEIHSFYLTGSSESIVLRCLGYGASSIAVQAMSIFNSRVANHKLCASLSTELVPDLKTKGLNMRVVIFHIDIVD